ncbi:alanine:cation symporter family protein [Paraglaciecola agarilytica]|uniref:Alanine or glycine:cation symporter, AGCS family n=1 Tax=Paraglaciecola agarilytica NO2 TaxID=1125747 RepID=A0ABQ0I3U5_9ALTE|nr:MULTISPECIES: alanine/glycine:cation symporter family protein [Paraglaciecola]AEE22660.1 amino acid carrier protein [Glaciecola sp. 4H-3-7+YE-5]MBU3018189.1 alanine:cation symporter family protein [Paraglaciecola agarilytica]MDO6561705.1 alanine/glycine:cation symporter family protein [Paraglaciecola chathamensis]MDO6841744.1 alanine/glycine:cation symporter family protein [Paraglaciecola chathamensis]GAC04020.1 alanine or glycine:cation symporter, AGCS family [Paraglaciecola agarilytica NO
MISELVSFINNILWGEGQVLIYLLIIAGVWFTLKLNFIQIRHFRHMFSVMKGSGKSDKSGISSFQALCTSLSARVGTGNLAGVAVAISLGGAGAVFWMWVIALLGMATGFAESVLGQLYKVRDDNGEYRGGPAYYIQQGLNKRWLAITFALFLFLGYGFIFSAVQANTITDALNFAYDIPTLHSGLVIIGLAALIVVGGLRAIARFAEWVVPFMAVGYIAVTLFVTIMNIDLLPAMLMDIIQSAFGLQEAGAGALGAAFKNGVQRGLYSNEAGSGSVPHAAASATPNPNHPVSQGYVQMLGVFIDTMILCTCTAFVILLAGGSSSDQMEGIRLTQNAMSSHLGGGGTEFVAAAISLFAFTSVVANYAYGESNLHMFKLDNKLGRACYTTGYLAMILWGSMAALPEVWAAADMALGLMTVINITAIIMLTPTIVSISKDYFDKHKQGKNMEYHTGDCEIQGESEKGIWDKGE